MHHFSLYRVRVWLLLLSGLLTACGTMTTDKPKDLIDTDRMVKILTDVHVAESRVSRLGIGSVDSSNLVYRRLEGQILRKYSVDTSAYEKSYIYYSSHPREMEVIYKQIVKNLQDDITTRKKSPKP